MEIQPNLDEFKAIAKKGYRIPVFMDLTADCETPLSAYSKLAQEKPAFLFEVDILKISLAKNANNICPN